MRVFLWDTSDTGGAGQSPGVNVYEDQIKASIVTADEGKQQNTHSIAERFSVLSL